jgi:hypothetical protein
MASQPGNRKPGLDPVLEIPDDISDTVSFYQSWEDQVLSVGENLQAYLVFAVAINALGVVQQTRFSFLYLLVLLSLLFAGLAFGQAYLGVLRSRDAVTYRQLLGVALMISRVALAMVLVMIVQLIYGTATSLISDANWSMEHFILPFGVLALWYSEWLSMRARSRPDTKDFVNPVVESKPISVNGGPGRL